jgi:hypothetical protein
MGYNEVVSFAVRFATTAMSARTGADFSAVSRTLISVGGPERRKKPSTPSQVQVGRTVELVVLVLRRLYPDFNDRLAEAHAASGDPIKLLAPIRGTSARPQPLAVALEHWREDADVTRTRHDLNAQQVLRLASDYAHLASQAYEREEVVEAYEVIRWIQYEAWMFSDFKALRDSIHAVWSLLEHMNPNFVTAFDPPRASGEASSSALAPARAQNAG